MKNGLKLLRKVKGVWVAVAMMFGVVGAGEIVSAQETVSDPITVVDMPYEDTLIDEELPEFIEGEVVLEPVPETTEAPVEEVTEAPAEEVTEAPVPETTEAPAEETTEAPVEETTETKKEEKTEDKIADLDEKIKEKEAECQSCTIQIAELKDEIAIKETEITELEAEIKRVEEQQVIDEARLTELKERLANVDEIRAELEAKKLELTTELENTSADLDYYIEELALSEEERKQTETDKATVEEELAAANEDVADKQAALDRLTEEGIAAEIKALETEKSNLGQEIESLTQQIADLRAQSAENADTTAIETRIEELFDAMDEWKRVAGILQEQKDELLAQKTDLSDEINHYRDILGTLPVVGENRIILPPEFTMENIYKLFTGEMTGEEFDAITQPYSQQEGSQNQFVMNPGDNERIIPDLNNVSDELIQELTLYSMDIINQIREAVGISPLVANHSTIKFADDIAKRYVNDVYTWAQSRQDMQNGISDAGHYDKGISEEAGKNGLDDTYGNFYENLAWGYMEYEAQHAETGSGEWTEEGYVNVPVSNIKRAIYNSILNMMFDDGGEPNYGHLYSLVGLNEYIIYKDFEAEYGQYKETDPDWYNQELANIAEFSKGHFGFSMGNVKGDDYYQTRHHFITVTDSQVRDADLFDITDDFTLASVTQENEEVQQLLNEALAQYEEVNAQIAANEEEIQANNDHGTLVMADRDALAEQKVQMEELAAEQTAQADQLEETQMSKEERLAEVNTLLETLSEENANLAQAIADAQETLTNAETNKELKENDLAALNELIGNLNYYLEDLADTANELDEQYKIIATKLADVESELNALDYLPELIEEQQKTLFTHAANLEELSKQLNDKEAELTPLKEELTALEENCEEVADKLAELKEKREKLAASIKPEETKKTVTVVKKDTKATVKKSATLPETGEKEQNVLPAVAILLTTGLGIITLSKRREEA